MKQEIHNRSAMREAKRVVVKVGSRLLSGEDGVVDQTLISRIVDQISVLKGEGIEVSPPAGRNWG